MLESAVRYTALDDFGLVATNPGKTATPISAPARPRLKHRLLRLGPADCDLILADLGIPLRILANLPSACDGHVAHLMPPEQ